MISQFMDVYIDDIIIKVAVIPDHLGHLTMAFEQIRKHKLKMNPLKHAFKVHIGNFLGFLIHQKGIEVNKNKVKLIIKTQLPKTKKEL